ncbi:sensor domain-containing diguanylate cyclase [Metapseudomonas lalkuanensis]|uniref:diguanylate cyclase n=1 Tax=Metapseudomonas lalkuanensis TaxID=2604832 RepID=UPI001CF10E9B|nr:diguanylate cyclase [Pseudomonas lalkuanensis]UCO97721.1 sensor domain-containing diguanylate cyclase [Pseudomonas lalkuanensis]
MRRPILTLFLLLCWLGLAVPAQAAFELTPQSSGATLNGAIDLLEDPDGTLDIQDMARPEVQQRFTPANGRATVGQSRSVWWVRVQLSRSGDAPQQWWLENSGITVYRVSLFLPDGQGGWSRQESSEALPFAETRDYSYRRMLFKLPEIGAEPLTLYFRSYDPAGNSFPLKVWQLDDLKELKSTENLGFGLVYGVILALFLYNLFILVALRDKAYLWYVLATSSALVFILSMTGHGFQYFWPDAPVPVWLDRITLPSLWGIFVMRFTQELLYTKRGLRWSDRLFNVACVLYAVAILINFFGYRAEGAILIAVTPIVTVPTALISAVIRWRQGFIPARFYLIGYGTVLISTAILVMRAAGLIQPINFTAYMFPVAIAAESILFSFALAYRIQMLKQERAAALVQADREKAARLAQMQASADELQAAVVARTAELAAANQRLCERERELEHAAFHDALTELPNRRYLIERTESALANAKRHEEPLALLLIDLDHFKPINDRFGHDAGDEMLRTIGRRLRQHVRGGDAVARLGGDEFAVLIGGADAEAEACDLARRLLEELSAPMSYGAEQLTVSISIGIALFPQHARHFSGLYQTADQALYKVKARGRSGMVLFGEDGELSEEASLQLDVLKIRSGLL